MVDLPDEFRQKVPSGLFEVRLAAFLFSMVNTEFGGDYDIYMVPINLDAIILSGQPQSLTEIINSMTSAITGKNDAYLEGFNTFGHDLTPYFSKSDGKLYFTSNVRDPEKDDLSRSTYDIYRLNTSKIKAPF
jgi:hypothetical protein